MSERSSTAEFPSTCSNQACALPLAGPVAFCPYCGTATAKPEALKPAPPAAQATGPVAQAKPTPPPAAPAPSQPQPEAAPAAEAPRPVATPTAEPSVPAEPTPRKKPRKLPLIAAAVILAVIGLGWLGRTPHGPDLHDARQCLTNGDYACAQQQARLALQAYPNDPAARQLLQQSQQALQQQAQAQREIAQRKLAEEKARLAEAQRQATEEQARLVEARRLAAEEQARREAAQRLAEEQALQSQAAVQSRQTAPPTPDRSSVPAGNNAAAKRMLEQARTALLRKDYQSAISLAGTAKEFDPGNRQADTLIRQAEQQKRQALQSTTIE